MTEFPIFKYRCNADELEQLSDLINESTSLRAMCFPVFSKDGEFNVIVSKHSAHETEEENDALMMIAMAFDHLRVKDQ